ASSPAGAAAPKVFPSGGGLKKNPPPPGDEPHPRGEVTSPAVPWHPQVVISRLQPPDAVIPHAGILRQHHLDCMPPDLQLPAEPVHRIPQATRLGRWSALSRDHHYVHGPPTPAPPIRCRTLVSFACPPGPRSARTTP